MKFTLTTTEDIYDINSPEIERLKILGFSFSEEKGIFDSSRPIMSIKSSPDIEINTLEELIKLKELFGPLILQDQEIEIYNGYRE